VWELQTGSRRILRFTTAVANRGDADLYVGDPNEYSVCDSGCLFSYATCHAHYHFNRYANYDLVSATTGKHWRTVKVGFCMLVRIRCR
jgi:hypothetical protein